MSFTRQFTLLSGAVFLCAATATAQTAPSSIFQLNGNAGGTVSTCTYNGVGGQVCDNWNLLNGTGNNIPGGGVGANSSPGNSSVRTFVNGMSTTDNFTGGGSKDPNPISQWAYSGGPTPNKDTLNAAYAAAYNQNGDFLVIFGADRLSPNGDANIGIWFFQQSVGPNGTGGFTGAHSKGDVFVISSFTGGGGTSTITVYEWDQPNQPAGNTGCPAGVKNPVAGQCADTNLRLLASPATVCGTAAYCAITNSASTTTTWEGSIASPLFFEGGVNISAAFQATGGSLPCFSSFLVETRSSQSTTAVLKDFLAGGFPVCSMSISKSCGTATVNASGNAINYPVSGTVKNTGIGTLYNVTVFDTIGSSTTPNQISVTNNTANSPNLNTSTLGAGETGTWSDTSSSTSLSQSDSAIAKGATSSASGATLDVTSSNTATATCSTSVSTSLTVTKSCTTSLTAAAQVQVAFSGTVCNNGSSQVTNVSLKDYPSDSTTGATIATGITLQPKGTAGGTDCASFASTYLPTKYDSSVNGGTGPGRYFFTDLITIQTATPAVGTITALSNQTDPRCNQTYGCAPASCPLCQGSGQCTP